MHEINSSPGWGVSLSDAHVRPSLKYFGIEDYTGDTSV